MPLAKKYGPPFQDATIEREWEDGHTLVRVKTLHDLNVLSQNGGGCSRYHAFWTCYSRPICEYFFVMMKPRPTSGIGPILFCKRSTWRGITHPEESRYNEWYDRMVREEPIFRNSPYPMRLSSNYYDRHGLGEGYNDVAYYERRVADLEQRYQREKEEAIRRHGPLRKDHPEKPRVDMANAEVNRWRGYLEKERRAVRIHPGMEFSYRRVKLFVIQLSGRGVGYGGTDDTYVPKFLEFMRKEPHGTTSKR